MDFGRLVTAMVTPFNQSLQIDWEQTAKLIDWLIEEQKSDSIVVCGTTGESPTLSEKEKEELFHFAVRHVNGRAKVIAGTGSYDTAHTIHLTHLAENAGVDGVLLVAPYYNRPSAEGLYQHFATIAASTRLPIMLYNIPSRTGINISVEVTERLSLIPNIVAIKESSGELDHMSNILTRVSPNFKLYSGDDSIILPVMSIGGYGVVSVASHVIGKPIREMMDAYLSGQVAKASEMHIKYTPVFKGLFKCPHRVPNPVPVKYALGVCGIPVGDVRLPLVKLTADEANFVQSLMEQFQLVDGTKH